MIAFGTSITAPQIYERCARQGIKLVAEPDSKVLAQPAAGSVFRSYNLIIEQAAKYDELEALVIIHQDAEIVDSGFCAKLRAALRQPDVGLVGCVGAVDVRGIAWWEGSATWGSFVHRYEEFGGGEFPAFSWTNEKLPPYARTGEVDMLDGFVLGLSPWVVQNIRFDETLGVPLHGYDFDFCLQVRAAKRKVVTADFKVVHHHSLELLSDPDSYIEAHMKLAEKWAAWTQGVGGEEMDWKRRARRAEAEAAVARLQGISKQLAADAREVGSERALQEALTSVSWRVTAPLRRLRSVLKTATPRVRAPSSSRRRPIEGSTSRRSRAQ